MNFKKAMQLIERGALLIMTHTDEGDMHTLSSGELIRPITADAIKRHSNIEPNKDSLFPGEAPQSWRMRRAEAA